MAMRAPRDSVGAMSASVPPTPSAPGEPGYPATFDVDYVRVYPYIGKQ